MAGEIVLDGIDISELVQVGHFADTGVVSIVELSTGGKPNIWEDTHSAQNITLTGNENSGCMQRSKLNDLFELASVPNATYPMVLHGESLTVRFRNEDGAIEAEPIGRKHPEDTDWYKNITIKLMVV